MGIGHVIRCLALAQQFTDKNVFFLSAKLNGNAHALIASSGFQVIEIEAGLSVEKDSDNTVEVIEAHNINTVIVDHYGLGKKWQDTIKSRVKLVVIDDYAHTSHHAHLVVDSGRLASTARDENDLFGLKYCLLRNDFKQLRCKAIDKREITKNIKSVLVSFGGTDIKGFTISTVELLRKSGFKGDIILLVASGINHLSEIKRLENVTLHIDETHVADILLESDLAIGSLGGSAWERCCMGLPSISVKVAENQNNIESILLSNAATVLIEDISTQLEPKLKEIWGNDIAWWKYMSDQCFGLCDGKGAGRVAERVLSL